MTPAFSDMAKRLNGWQRLWIVLCVVTAVGVAGSVLVLWPKETDFLEDRAIYAVELALNATAAKAKRAGNESDELNLLRALDAGPRRTRIETYGDLSAVQILERVQPTLAGTPELQLLETRRLKDQAALTVGRQRHLAVGFTIWLAIAAISYAIGWSVAWVHRGFKHSDEV